MKNFYIILFIVSTYFSYAQVGINTTTPNALLDIAASSATSPTNNDGILVPRIDVFPTTNPTALQNGMMVYLTTTSGGDLPGFYHWDNPTTKWIGMGNWNLKGNSGTSAANNFIGTTDSAALMFKVNNVFSGFLSPSGRDNTAFGYESMHEDNGFWNTAFGTRSLGNNHGGGNTAVGWASLYSNSTGSANVAIGDATLHYNSSGASNVAVGSHSMMYNRANLNTAVGSSSLRYNNSGASNTAIGTYSMYLNDVGNNNSAMGFGSLGNNKSGSFNTAVGNFSLLVNSTGSYNCALGNIALQKNTTGEFNIGIGHNSLVNNTTGNGNTAVGTHALFENTTGEFNTGVGFNALNLNTSSNLTAVGYNSLSKSTGESNTAIGSNALAENLIGEFNVAAGSGALSANTIGKSNIAIGTFALQSNAEGNDNTAVGVFALERNTASNNTAVGSSALGASTTSEDNTAIGWQALRLNTTGTGNTSVGSLSLDNNTTGDFCTTIGFKAGNANLLNVSNFIAIGHLSGGLGASNSAYVGNTSTATIGGQVGWTNFSDERIKKNIQNNVPGLSFIKKLRPVTYYFDIHKENEIVYKGKETPDWEGKYDIEKQLQTGFIAQEVEATAKKLGYKFNGVTAPKTDNGLYGLQYATFVVPLVKAVQEQQTIIEQQNQRIEKLEAQLKLILEKQK